ncbi:MAG: hypothetical protein ACO2PO_15180 [Candidatus Calescibacterium sp.]|jgi:hypothetical protein
MANFDYLKMLRPDIITKGAKVLELLVDFFSTHPQALFQFREYAEKTQRIEELELFLQAILEIMETRRRKEEKNG